MIKYPELRRIGNGETSAQGARAVLSRLLAEKDLAVLPHIYAAFRIWTSRMLRVGHMDRKELERWFDVFKSVAARTRKMDIVFSYKIDTLAEIVFDYLRKVERMAADAADPFHREYLVHRRLGRFMRGDLLDFVSQRPPGELSWSGQGDQCVEFIHVRRPGTRDVTVQFIEFEGTGLQEIERALKEKERQIAGVFDLPYPPPSGETE